MDRITLLFFLEQLCEKEMIKQINQCDDIMAIKNLIEPTFCKEPNIPQATSILIAMRDFKYRLIENYESVRSTLTQLNTLEESILLVIPSLSLKDFMRPRLKLIEVLLLDTKREIQKIALLEMKQIIVQLIPQLSIKETLHYLLQHEKLNYHYFLGYEAIDRTDMTYSQITYGKSNSTPTRETRIESMIYQRRMKKNIEFNKAIRYHINEKTLEMLQNSFVLWTKQFPNNPIPNQSLEIICSLWLQTIEEVKQILLRKPKKDAIEGQLDLWSYQKTKSPILDDLHNL